MEAAAHSNEVTALPMSPLHSAMMPSVVTTNSPESLSKYPPIRLALSLEAVNTAVSTGADTKANAMWGGGALQLLEHTVPLDAARDNDG